MGAWGCGAGPALLPDGRKTPRDSEGLLGRAKEKCPSNPPNE